MPDVGDEAQGEDECDGEEGCVELLRQRDECKHHGGKEHEELKGDEEVMAAFQPQSEVEEEG